MKTVKITVATCVCLLILSGSAASMPQAEQQPRGKHESKIWLTAQLPPGPGQHLTKGSAQRPTQLRAPQHVPLYLASRVAPHAEGTGAITQTEAHRRVDRALRQTSKQERRWLALLEGARGLDAHPYLFAELLERAGVHVVDFSFTAYDGAVRQHYFEHIHSPLDPMREMVEKAVIVNAAFVAQEDFEVSLAAAAAWVGTTPETLESHVIQLKAWAVTQPPGAALTAMQAVNKQLEAAAEDLSLRAFEVLRGYPGIGGVLGIVGPETHLNLLAPDGRPSSAAHQTARQIAQLLQTRDHDRQLANLELTSYNTN